MAALKFSWHCWTLALAVVAVTGSTFAAQRVFTRHTGMSLTLAFPTPAGSDHVRLVRLGSGKYIFYCRDGHPIRPKDQEESFKGRVGVTGCDKINGTVTITLSNLTSSDNGTYEFHGMDSDERRFSETIILNVTDPDERPSFTTSPTTGPTAGLREGGGKQVDGSVGLIVGLTVFGLVLLVIIAGIMYIIFMHVKNPYHLPAV